MFFVNPITVWGVFHVGGEFLSTRVRRTGQALFRRPDRVRPGRRTRVKKKLALNVRYTPA